MLAGCALFNGLPRDSGRCDIAGVPLALLVILVILVVAAVVTRLIIKRAP